PETRPGREASAGWTWRWRLHARGGFARVGKRIGEGMMMLIATLLLAAQAYAPPAGAPAAGPPIGLELKKPKKFDKYYPKDLRKSGVEGRTVIALRLAQDGKVTDCAVRAGADNPALDAAACALGREMRFAKTETAFTGPLPIK